MGGHHLVEEVPVTRPDLPRTARLNAAGARRLRAFAAPSATQTPTPSPRRGQYGPQAQQIATSRICSASSTGKAAVSSPEIVRSFRRLQPALALPPEWTPRAAATFLEDEAARISQQVAQLADQMGAQSVAEWTQRPGEHPDYLTKVGLLNTAMASAKEIVLSQQLYELIPEPPEDARATETRADAGSQSGAVGSALDTHPVPQRTQRGRSRTWPRRSGPTRSSRRCFGSRPATCWRPARRTTCRCPAHPEDPLAEELAQLVYSDLRHDGLPER